jgi:rhodanese-related sulfurtransferase
MTDSPRFQRIEHKAEDAYRRYHGAGLVAFTFLCADRWMAWRERRTHTRANAPFGQLPHDRQQAQSNTAAGTRDGRSAQVGNAVTQSGARSSRQGRAVLLSALPIVLAMAASLPADANAWGEFDVPSSKKSRFGRHLLAFDAYNIVRRASDRVLFLDVRTTPESELLGVPRLIDANVPFLLHATISTDAEQRGEGQLVTNDHFVREVSDRLAAKALTPDTAIILICADGTRSARAADRLSEAGYTQVYTIIDGFEGDQVATSTPSGRRAANGWKLSRLPWFYPADPSRFQYKLARP